MNETDAFPRFQFFLKRKLKELSTIENNNGIREIADEISYEVHRVNIEAQKLSKLRIMQGISIGIFTVSLGALLLSIPGIREIAGILGTTTFYNIIKEHFETKTKYLDLKKDNFYIPFLFEKLASHHDKNKWKSYKS